MNAKKVSELLTIIVSLFIFTIFNYLIYMALNNSFINPLAYSIIIISPFLLIAIVYSLSIINKQIIRIIPALVCLLPTLAIAQIYN